MTTNTNRNHIISVSSIVTFMVVVMSSLLRTISTFLCCRVRHFASSNSIPNAGSANLLHSVLFIPFANCIQGLCAPSVFSCSFLTFFSLAIFSFVLTVVYSIASFTYRPLSVFTSFLIMKFGEFFNFLATSTSFCFNWFRHGFFLVKKLCLEPLQTQYLCGSFYSTALPEGVK